MKLDPRIIALKDFENNHVIWLKLARYSTAYVAPSINASEQPIKNPVHNKAPNILGYLRFVHNIYDVFGAGIDYYHGLFMIVICV